MYTYVQVDGSCVPLEARQIAQRWLTRWADDLYIPRPTIVWMDEDWRAKLPTGTARFVHPRPVSGVADVAGGRILLSARHKTIMELATTLAHELFHFTQDDPAAPESECGAERWARRAAACFDYKHGFGPPVAPTYPALAAPPAAPLPSRASPVPRQTPSQDGTFEGLSREAQAVVRAFRYSPLY